MEATTRCNSRPTRKQVLIQMATTIPAIVFAELSGRLGYGVIGWFICGLIMGGGILFAYKKAEKRWTTVNFLTDKFWQKQSGRDKPTRFALQHTLQKLLTDSIRRW